MTRLTVIALMFALILGSTFVFLGLVDSSPHLGLFILFFGLAGGAFVAAVFLPASPASALAHKSWDHLSCDIEALHTEPSTLGDKVRGLQELYAALVRKFDYNETWTTHLRFALRDIERLSQAGEHREANAVAVAQLNYAAKVLVEPRQQALQARLKHEAQVAAKLAEVEFVS